MVQPLLLNMTRRKFIEKSIYGGAGLAAFSLTGSSLYASTRAEVINPAFANLLDGISPTETRYGGTVAVWFSSHYQVDQRDWTNIQEFGNDYHPLAGYYKSDDPAILKKQLHWMRRAGIDAIVYDVFSTGVWNLTDLPKDKTLQLLLKELADPQSEAHHFKLIIWLEKYCSTPTPEEYEYAFAYIKEHLANREFYFHYEGKPLVVPYLNAALGDLDDTLEKYRAEFAIRYIRAEKSDFWSYINHSPQQIRKGWICASPGMDSYLEDAHISRHVNHQTSPPLGEIRARAQRMPRQNGTTFVRQLQLAKQNNPEIIFVSGWNDWQYGCQIEPAVEYRFFYLDLTSKVLGRWAETAAFRDEA